MLRVSSRFADVPNDRPNNCFQLRSECQSDKQKSVSRRNATGLRRGRECPVPVAFKPAWFRVKDCWPPEGHDLGTFFSASQLPGRRLWARDVPLPDMGAARHRARKGENHEPHLHGNLVTQRQWRSGGDLPRAGQGGRMSRPRPRAATGRWCRVRAGVANCDQSAAFVCDITDDVAGDVVMTWLSVSMADVFRQRRCLQQIDRS